MKTENKLEIIEKYIFFQKVKKHYPKEATNKIWKKSMH